MPMYEALSCLALVLVASLASADLSPFEVPNVAYGPNYNFLPYAYQEKVQLPWRHKRSTPTITEVACPSTATLNNTTTILQFSSPNYPKNYPKSYDCTWTVNFPAYAKVSMTIVGFNVAGSLNNSCTTGDYLSLNATSSCNYQLSGNLCTTIPAGAVQQLAVQPVPYSMKMRFFANNDANVATGFRLQLGLADPCSNSCNGTQSG